MSGKLSEVHKTPKFHNIVYPPDDNRQVRGMIELLQLNDFDKDFSEIEDIFEYKSFSVKLRDDDHPKNLPQLPKEKGFKLRFRTELLYLEPREEQIGPIRERTIDNPLIFEIRQISR